MIYRSNDLYIYQPFALYITFLLVPSFILLCPSCFVSSFSLLVVFPFLFSSLTFFLIFSLSSPPFPLPLREVRLVPLRQTERAPGPGGDDGDSSLGILGLPLLPDRQGHHHQRKRKVERGEGGSVFFFSA